MRYAYLSLAFVVVAVLSILGFRGTISERPPLEFLPDMYRQPKYHPQGESRFFGDGRADRPVPANTVARGALDAGFVAVTGRIGDSYVAGFPVEVTGELMARGRDRYQIFCYPCHGGTGDGAGITREYGMVATPSFHQDRLREMSEGEIFDVITNGRNLMGRYGDKIEPDDRWAIIAYVRALQRAQTGTPADVPPAERARLGL
jgi:mono/diheme cytochrome c family protein